MRPLDANRLADRYRTMTGVRGGTALPSAGEDLWPVVVLEEPRPETELSAGFFLFGGRLSRAAVAAQTNHFFFRNPPGSGKIVTITKLGTLSVPGNSILVSAFPAPALPAGTTLVTVASCRDLRTRNIPAVAPGLASLELRFLTDGVATYGSGNVDAIPTVAGSLSFNAPYVLGEGDMVIVENSAVNQGLDIVVQGYERARYAAEEG